MIIFAVRRSSFSDTYTGRIGVLPVCDAYEQEYYRKNNRFYENYEKQQICQVLREDVEGQKSESALKLGQQTHLVRQK